METAHAPVLEMARAELAQARAHDKRELEAELSSLRSCVQDVSQTHEDAMMQMRGEVETFSRRMEETPLLQKLDDRLGSHDRKISSLRAQIEALPQTNMDPSTITRDESVVRQLALDDLDDFKSR